MDHHIQNALGFARQVSPVISRNLIAPDESYQNALQEVIRSARDVLDAYKLKASMSYERRTHVNAMSKSPSTPRLSTAANVVRQIGT